MPYMAIIANMLFKKKKDSSMNEVIPLRAATTSMAESEGTIAASSTVEGLVLKRGVISVEWIRCTTNHGNM